MAPKSLLETPALEYVRPRGLEIGALEYKKHVSLLRRLELHAPRLG